MLVTSNDSGYDTVLICYDCGMSIKYVQDKFSIT